MAQFEGTIEEFMRFIGPHARIMVMNITRNYRKKVGKCEECASPNKLESAHVKGKERPKIISHILSNFIEDDIIKVNLSEFEDLFIDAHTPIEKTIRILCYECHRKYDRVDNISGNTQTDQNEVVLEYDQTIETKIVSDLVNNSIMNRAKAVNLLNDKIGIGLSFKNTIFSNIGSSSDLWWLEPSNEKFNDDFYFILNNSYKNVLLLFKVPKGSIQNPQLLFRQRKDKGEVSQIIIPVSDSKFVDKRGFSFDSFLINQIDY